MIKTNTDIQHRQNREQAIVWAAHLEIVASLVKQYDTTQQASDALMDMAFQLERKWAGYPVRAKGEREYASWGVDDAKPE